MANKTSQVLEMIHGKAKRSNICGAGVLVDHIHGMFDLVVFKVILGEWGHSVYLLFFR